MNRIYLTVFEGQGDNWSAFAPDVPGTGGLGGSIDEARASVREGIRQMVEYLHGEHRPAPPAQTTNVDFAEFGENPPGTLYYVEFLAFEFPELEAQPVAA